MHTPNRKTTSLCNVCRREVPARVYEEEDRIIMLKRCPQHGIFCGLVEKDPDFYRWFRMVSTRRHLSFSSLLLPVTDMPLRRIASIAKKFKGSSIVLSGTDLIAGGGLARVINAVKDAGKTTVLETDGVRLVDAQYLGRLKDAGLDEVLFSLDSLKASFFGKQKPCSQDTLTLKKEALLNLKREHIPVVIVSTIYPGCNDEELNDLFVFALHHSDFVTQIRFRSCVPGKTSGQKPVQGYMLSELLGLFSRQVKIHKEDLKIRFFKKRLGRSIIFSINKMDVKLVGWPTIENIDLQDLNTTMAYFSRNRLLKVFHGVILEEASP